VIPESRTPIRTSSSHISFGSFALIDQYRVSPSISRGAPSIRHLRVPRLSRGCVSAAKPCIGFRSAGVPPALLTFSPAWQNPIDFPDSVGAQHAVPGTNSWQVPTIASGSQRRLMCPVRRPRVPQTVTSAFPPRARIPVKPAPAIASSRRESASIVLTFTACSQSTS
jgi:hypothetical protein